jgi:hypothetical protein
VTATQVRGGWWWCKSIQINLGILGVAGDGSRPVNPVKGWSTPVNTVKLGQQQKPTSHKQSRQKTSILVN